PPQGPSQGGSARSPNIEPIWQRLPMPHDGEYRVCDRRSGESGNRWIYATDMAQRRCHCKAGPIGKINRCASHAAAYVQQDMDSRIEAQLHRPLLENTSIANLQTV
ncbi:hypothetical protein PZH32_11870, partial [Adlercreutzia equolifaciens]